MSENSRWPETEYSCDGGGGCVMVRRVAGAIVIWDSKNPYQPGLVFSRKEYAQFRSRVLGDSWPRTAVRIIAGLAKVALQAVLG
ncbi:MAG TPA: DUF397 domain-containing protein [Trebonia sp.]|nr:DUF397 domain-containing protein [Trebonia sp.]